METVQRTELKNTILSWKIYLLFNIIVAHTIFEKQIAWIKNIRIELKSSFLCGCFLAGSLDDLELTPTDTKI